MVVSARIYVVRFRRVSTEFLPRSPKIDDLHVQDVQETRSLGGVRSTSVFVVKCKSIHMCCLAVRKSLKRICIHNTVTFHTYHLM